MILALVIIICVMGVVSSACLIYKEFFMPKSKRVAYLVHVQGRTETDEHMDFAITLAEGEEDKWDSQLEAAFAMREKRLKYQNDRMIELMKKKPEEAKEEDENSN